VLHQFYRLSIGHTHGFILLDLPRPVQLDGEVLLLQIDGDQAECGHVKKISENAFHGGLLVD